MEHFGRFLLDGRRLVLGAACYVSLTDFIRSYLESRVGAKVTRRSGAFDSKLFSYLYKAAYYDSNDYGDGHGDGDTCAINELMVKHGLSVVTEDRVDPSDASDLRCRYTFWVTGCTTAALAKNLRRISAKKPLTARFAPSTPARSRVGWTDPTDPTDPTVPQTTVGGAGECDCTAVAPVDVSAACGHCTAHFVLAHFFPRPARVVRDNIAKEIKRLADVAQPLLAAMFPVQLMAAFNASRADPRAPYQLSATLYRRCDDAKVPLQCTMRSPTNRATETYADFVQLVQHQATRLPDNQADQALASIDNHKIKQITLDANTAELACAKKHRLSTQQIKRLLLRAPYPPTTATATTTAASSSAAPGSSHLGPAPVVVLMVDARFLPYQSVRYKRKKEYCGHYIVVHGYSAETGKFQIHDSCFSFFQYVSEHQLNAIRKRSAMWNASAAIVVTTTATTSTTATTATTATAAVDTKARGKAKVESGAKARVKIVSCMPVRFSRRLVKRPPIKNFL